MTDALTNLSLRQLKARLTDGELSAAELADVFRQRAKQTAHLLFFVIDNQTRSTASMVEAAHLAGGYTKIHVNMGISLGYGFMLILIAETQPVKGRQKSQNFTRNEEVL